MRRRQVAIIGSILLSGGCFFFAFRGIDAAALLRLAAEQNVGPILLASLFIFLQIAFAGERWRRILNSVSRTGHLDFLRIQLVFYSSTFFNYLPVGTAGGDIARVWLARHLGLTVKRLTFSVLVDRLLVVVCLLLLAALTLPFLRNPLLWTTWYFFLAATLACFFALVFLPLIEHALRGWETKQIIQVALRVVEETRRLVSGNGSIAFGWALCSALSAPAAAFCIARSLSIDVGILAMVAIMAVVMILSALPISFAGWGVRESSIVTLLAALGVPQASSLLISVEYGLLATLISLPGGLVWLMLRRPSKNASPESYQSNAGDGTERQSCGRVELSAAQ